MMDLNDDRSSDPFLQGLADAVAGLGEKLERPDRSVEFYRDEPKLWASERCRRTLWSRQAEVIEAVRDHRRVAVKSCHSTGKTTGAATLAGWWIDVHEPGEAFVITTAPTGPQVKALLWREIGRLHRAAKLPGRINLTEWYLGEELVAFGRKSSDYDENAFQGVHALRVLVIIDEANGVAASIWDAAESIASNRHSKILAVGNPDSPDSEFAARCRSSIWHTIQIGYADTPNFTGEDVPRLLLDSLISREWVDEREQEWGRESALFQSKCLGEFPDKATESMVAIPYGMIAKCRVLDGSSSDGGSSDGSSDLIQAGVDVGGGGDSTVVFERVGDRSGRWIEFRDPDPMATVGKISMQLREWKVQKVKVDVTGLGWGIYGRLRELSSHHRSDGTSSDDSSHHAEVVGVNFGARSTYSKRFANKRAEIWWNGRELARTYGWRLGSLTDSIVNELCMPKYEIMDSFGKIKIEAKDDVKKRLHGKSTDFADALLLAFYDGPSTLKIPGLNGDRADTSAVQIFAEARLDTGRRGGPGSLFSGAMPFGSLRRGLGAHRRPDGP